MWAFSLESLKAKYLLRYFDHFLDHFYHMRTGVRALGVDETYLTAVSRRFQHRYDRLLCGFVDRSSAKDHYAVHAMSACNAGVVHDMDIDVRDVSMAGPGRSATLIVDYWHPDRLSFDLEPDAVRLARNQNGSARFIDDGVVFTLLHSVQVEAKIVTVEFQAHLPMAVPVDQGNRHSGLHLFPGERDGSQSK